MVLKLECTSESPKGFVKTQMAEAHPRVFSLLGLEWGLKFCFLVGWRVILTLLVQMLPFEDHYFDTKEGCQ